MLNASNRSVLPLWLVALFKVAFHVSVEVTELAEGLDAPVALGQVRGRERRIVLSVYDYSGGA